MDEAQAEIKIPGRNINNFRNANGTTLMAESEEVLKSLLMRVKEQSEKAGLKLNIQNTKLMEQNLVKQWKETLHFLGLQNHADGDCTHDIKRCLFLGRKAMTNLDSILKSRDITLLTKVHIVKTMLFPVVMYR